MNHQRITPSFISPIITAITLADLQVFQSDVMYVRTCFILENLELIPDTVNLPIESKEYLMYCIVTDLYSEYRHTGVGNKIVGRHFSTN